MYFLLWTAEGRTEIQNLCRCYYRDLTNWFITSSTGVTWIWISYLWFHLFLVLIALRGSFVPVSSSIFLCSDPSRGQSLWRTPASPEPFSICRSPQTLPKVKKWTEWGRFGAVGRGRWVALGLNGSWSRGTGGRGIMWNSGAGPGVITKLPKPYAAATTSETHEADPLLCWSAYGE